MTWQATKERLNLRFAQGRTWLATHVTRKRLIIGTLLTGTAMLFALSLEAMLRARLGVPESRVPTSLYTRPVAWDGSDAAPVAIGTLNGSTTESRIPVRLDQVPVHLIDAVLAVEDQRFFDHEGLDVKRIGGAFIANVKAGGIAQGGSTITQQLAKNLFLGAERTPMRKLREAAIAAVLEARYTKEQILEAYLNEVYLGHDNGAAIHGVGAASRFYFGKDVERVVLSEAASLAAMIKAPNRLAPHRHPEALRERRNLVLQLMVEQGRVPPRSRDQSSRVPVPTRVHPQRSIDGRWFRDHALEGAPRGMSRRGGAVYTTLDANLQRAAERAVSAGNGAPQAALVAIDPRTGDILAMVGGRDYGASQFNRATDAMRQPGSAFKPIVALAALERHDGSEPSYTLASTLDDSPLQVRTAQGPWQPANYDGTYRGEVTLRQALEQSLNIPFARIGLDIGPARIVSTARRLGITAPLQEVPSLALGASEVSLLELVRAYGALATGGELAASRRILARARLGEPADAVTEPQVQRVADPASVWLVTSALQGVVRNGTGRGLGRYGVAGKTGTSNNWRDAWFVAYTPDLVVGVWVGHDDGRSLRQTGGAAAVPIVSRFMGFAGIDVRDFEIPEGIVEGYTGGGGWFSPCGEREYFLEGTAPGNEGCWQVEFDENGDAETWGETMRRRAEDWVRERLRDAERELR